MTFSKIGRGKEAMVTFTTIMNMPPPMNKDNFDAINDKLHDAYISGATESMKRAAFEVREIINPSCKNDKLIDCGVSIDGSWQHKGFSSLNGVIATNSRDNSVRVAKYEKKGWMGQLLMSSGNVHTIAR